MGAGGGKAKPTITFSAEDQEVNNAAPAPVQEAEAAEAETEGVEGTAAAAAAAEPIAVKEHEPTSKLDADIMAALKLRKEAHAVDGQKHITSFNKVILNFYKVETALSGVQEVFKEFDTDKSGFIEYGELVKVMEKLNVEGAGEKIQDIFNEANFYNNGKLTFKEFIIAVALGFLLKIVPEEGILDLKSAFEIILDAYLLFDSNTSGSIDKAEMLATLESANSNEGVKGTSKKGTGGGSNSFFTAERWNEADWDKDGTITFKEFFMAFCSWIDLEE